MLTNINSWGYTHQFMLLETVPRLDSGLYLYEIQHRFHGAIDGDLMDNTFGIVGGANTDFSLAYGVFDQSQLEVHRVSEDREWSLGFSSLVHEFSQVQIGAGLTVSSYKPFSATTRDIQYSPYILVESTMIESVLLATNLVYDSQESTVGVGVGATFPLFGKFNGIVEWMANTQSSKYFSAIYGLQSNTFGHQFSIYIGNNRSFGLSRESRGAISQNYGLGFSITRVLDFGS